MRQKHTTIIGLLGVSAIVIALLGIMVFIGMRITINEQVTRTLQEKIITEEQQSTEFTTLTKTIKATEAQNAQLAKYVLTPEDVVPFLTTLEQVGKDTNTEVVLTTVAVEQKKETIPAHLAVTLTATGSFENVYRTLRTFEALPYEHTITSVIFTAGGAQGFKNSTTSKTVMPTEALWKLSLSFTITSVQF